MQCSTELIETGKYTYHTVDDLLSYTIDDINDKLTPLEIVRVKITTYVKYLSVIMRLFKNLEILISTSEDLTTISFIKYMPKLREICISSKNEIDEYQYKIVKISTLNGIQYCKHVEKIILRGCHLITVKHIKYLIKLKELNCIHCKFNKIPRLHTYNLSYVKLSDCRLKTLQGITYCNNIKYLDVSFNDIHSLKWLSKYIKLRRLCCSYNMIDTLHGLENSINITELDCRSNRITTLKHIRNCITIKELMCHMNKIVSLKWLSQMTNLTIIKHYNDESLDTKGIQKCIKIKKGLFGISHLSDYNFLNNSSENIKELQIRSDDMKMIDFRKMKNLPKITVKGKENYETIYSFNNIISVTRSLMFIARLNRVVEFDLEEYMLSHDIFYKHMEIFELNKYNDYLGEHLDIILLHNFDNFVKSEYFYENYVELINKYHNLSFPHITIENINEDCPVCLDPIHGYYIKCVNKHVICRDCYKYLIRKDICCVCSLKYKNDITFYLSQ